MKLCEACNGTMAGAVLTITEDDNYILCLNCLSPLVNLNLTSKQFFSLIKNGHTTSEFYLHSDFYNDETGEALQPKGEL